MLSEGITVKDAAGGMKYEPYNFDSFLDLVAHCCRLGWYTGKKVLFNLKCEGAFEGFNGRASEGWEQQFTLTSDEVQLDNGSKIPALNVVGATVKEVCDKAVSALRPL